MTVTLVGSTAVLATETRGTRSFFATEKIFAAVQLDLRNESIADAPCGNGRLNQAIDNGGWQCDSADLSRIF